ncbi:MAG: prolipoprotein diacylglyceryl transferase [Chloroflexi bacterium]|nr:MAG: prolipoprotein diacylglyceryl transferase [Chloroflexota bacterium]
MGMVKGVQNNRDGGKFRVEPHWLVIGGVWLATAVLFLYHLRTGITPDRVAFRIPFLELDVFWYGIWIVGGIFLGSVVVSRLALRQATAVFLQHVPPHLGQQSIHTLKLPKDLIALLEKNGYHTIAELLFQWGLDPRYLGLNREGLKRTADQLAKVKGVQKTWLTQAPWQIWNPDHVWNGIVWCLLLAVIGARLYHVLTPSPSMAAVGINSPLDYFRQPAQLFNLRNGGLGIYGGIAGGAFGLWLYTRVKRIPALAWADLAAIGVALGQVFGRWGNFFNQELYGRPTNLPWAITIEPQYRLPGFEQFSRFHPAFLYESLWSLLAFGILYTLHTRYQKHLKTGDLMALYLILYAIGRILLETVRLDSRTMVIAGLDLNIAVATFVSILVAIAMGIWIFYRHRIAR